MTDDVFEKVLYEIKAYNNYVRYDSDESDFVRISIARYSEPMADVDILFNRTKRIKEEIPNSYLWINTNGDYLDIHTIKYLSNIDNVFVMDYDSHGFEHTMDKINKLKLDISRIDFKEKKVFTTYNNTQLVFEYEDISKKPLRTRGNSIEFNDKYTWRNKGEKRATACDSIGKFVMIDYNGNIMPCCDTTSDYSQHKSDLCLGNIMDVSFSDIQFSKIDSSCESCKYCHYSSTSDYFEKPRM